MILGATDQKLWMFEVFRRSLGRVGMCWSQWGEVNHMRKKWGKEGGKGGGGQLDNKRGPHSDWWAPYVVMTSNFYKFFFGTFVELLGILGEWMYSTPIFWSLPLHLEVLNLPFLMEIEGFNIFKILFFPKFRVHLDLHIYRWDFCFMKNWDH
jgi:hypothetical protein